MPQKHPEPHPVWFGQAVEGYKHTPAQFFQARGIQGGWFQDGRRVRHTKSKTAKAFIWPKDGRNGSTWGRFKDIMNNKGPDVFVACGVRKSDCVANRPIRAQWSRHTNFENEDSPWAFKSSRYAPWTQNGAVGGRMPGLKYDFRTRQYVVPNKAMWTDARWQPEPYRNQKRNPYPEALRDGYGRWWQDRQYMPQEQGGPVYNEFGNGRWQEYWPDDL